MRSYQVEGITLEIMRKALAQAGDGRRHILKEMAKCSPPPRGGLSTYAPRVVRIKVRKYWWESLMFRGSSAVHEEGQVQPTT